jgi:hypothetical protein
VALIGKQSQELFFSRKRSEYIVRSVVTCNKEFFAMQNGVIGTGSEKALCDSLGGDVDECRAA